MGSGRAGLSRARAGADRGAGEPDVGVELHVAALVGLVKAVVLVQLEVPLGGVADAGLERPLRRAGARPGREADGGRHPSLTRASPSRRRSGQLPEAGDQLALRPVLGRLGGDRSRASEPGVDRGKPLGKPFVDGPGADDEDVTRTGDRARRLVDEPDEMLDPMGDLPAVRGGPAPALPGAGSCRT